METRQFRPGPRYFAKRIVVMAVIASIFMVAGLIIAGGVAEDDGADAALGVVVIFFLGNLLWFVPGLLLTVPYYRSLRYEIRDNEVIVHVGIWTKSVKHVPYRTVTNLKVNRDIFDRWFFGLGSLNVQTAGMSGTSGAEEGLVGLPNYQEVYELVQDRLRRYRGAMSPNAADEEDDQPEPALAAILTELRAIRTALDKKV
jgi:uncharacterized membrane protein YdbT with pleckstrin-like domain